MSKRAPPGFHARPRRLQGRLALLAGATALILLSVASAGNDKQKQKKEKKAHPEHPQHPDHPVHPLHPEHPAHPHDPPDEPPPPGEDPLKVEHGLTQPVRICTGADGKVFVSDAKVGSVFIYTKDLVLTGELKVGRPIGVAVDGDGRIYVGNRAKEQVEVYDAKGAPLFSIANIVMPNDMAMDRDGYLYVADSRRNEVLVFDSQGAWARTIGKADESFGGVVFPCSVTVAYRTVNDVETGELYVADQGHAQVHVFDLSGGHLRTLGGKIPAWSKDWQGKFTRIQSVAVDAQGRLHALDIFLLRIQVLDGLTGDFVSAYPAADDTAHHLRTPLDHAITADGKVLVTNSGLRRIEVFTVPD